MGMTRLVPVLCLLPAAGLAEVPQVNCTGTGAAFTLEVAPDRATFAYLDRTSEMQIMQHSVATGADWPIAATAVGPRDSAIILIEEAVEGRHAVRILTQRGETPILLAGQCTVAE